MSEDDQPQAPRGRADHLKQYQFAKGVSGNPAGRPKGTSVTDALRDLAETEHNGKRLAELVAERLMKEALTGKFQFLKELIERLDGKVPDKAQVEHTGGQRLYICPPPRLIGEEPGE